MRVLDRLPEGTVAVGGGLVVNGLTAYAFITLASRDLGAEAYSPDRKSTRLNSSHT